MTLDYLSERPFQEKGKANSKTEAEKKLCIFTSKFYCQEICVDV